MGLLLAQIKYFCYIVFGVLSAVTNLLLLIALLSGRRLRRSKEYLIIAGLCFADFSEGTAQWLAGVYRLGVLWLRAQNETVSPVLCMALPQANIWRWSELSTSTMLLVISLDRLYAVYKPLAYYGLGCRYAYKAVGCVYVLATVHFLLYWIYPIVVHNNKVSMMCGTNSIVHPTMYAVSKVGASVMSASSVLVYLAVVCLLEFRLERISAVIGADHQQQVMERQKRRQSRLTKTMGISCLLTFFLDSVPKSFGVYLSLAVSPNEVIFVSSLAQWVFLGNKVNATLNFLLLTQRHRPVRRAVLSVLCNCCCRKVEVSEEERRYAYGSTMPPVAPTARLEPDGCTATPKIGGGRSVAFSIADLSTTVGNSGADSLGVCETGRRKSDGVVLRLNAVGGDDESGVRRRQIGEIVDRELNADAIGETLENGGGLVFIAHL